MFCILMSELPSKLQYIISTTLFSFFHLPYFIWLDFYAKKSVLNSMGNEQIVSESQPPQPEKGGERERQKKEKEGEQYHVSIKGPPSIFLDHRSRIPSPPSLQNGRGGGEIRLKIPRIYYSGCSSACLLLFAPAFESLEEVRSKIVTPSPKIAPKVHPE